MIAVVASPSEIVRAYLASVGLVVLPAVPGRTVPFVQTPGAGSVNSLESSSPDTVCYTSSMPDDPDQVVFVENMVGMYFGRSQRSKTLLHPGVKVWVRTLDETGYSFVQAVVDSFDSFPPNSVVTVDGIDHYVQSIYRTGTIIPLGEQTGNRRQLWVMNVRVALQDREPSLG